MTLVRSSRGDGQPVDIPLDKWMVMGAATRYDYKLFSVGVDAFEGAHEDLPVDPYFLGLWFGDGTKAVREQLGGERLSMVAVTKPDPEVRTTCDEVAAAWGLHVVARGEVTNPTWHLVGVCGKQNALLDAMRNLVGSRIVVPDAYMRAPREQRLAFLAGFLDADAELACNCFIITQKRRDWAEAIWFVARSLGLCATMTKRQARNQDGFEGTYHVVTISGHTDQIPTRIPRRQAAPRRQIKNATRTGFDVAPLGVGDYYGFTLDGDGRFLLGDFTVTHNTFLLNTWLATTDKAVAVTASTGIAATHLGGQTLHSWLAASPERDIVSRLCTEAWMERHGKRLAAVDTLVIDECSMMDGKLMALAEAAHRCARGNHQPWGGVQVVLVGDLGQLPPVDVMQHGWCFQVPAWTNSNMQVVELRKTMRQSDQDFAALLHAVRVGEVSHGMHQTLEARVGAYDPDAEGAVRLMTHNDQADAVNAARLAELEGIEEFIAVENGQPSALRKLDKTCLSPRLLRLAVGARIMFTRNDQRRRFVNGTMGDVIAFNSDMSIEVSIDGGDTISVEQSIWEMKEWVTGVDGAYLDVVACRAQYPLRLAWAITIHKSQGLTLNKVSVDLSRCFSPGQAYVALSRCRSLEGLNIEDWRGLTSIIVHPMIVASYGQRIEA
jgi:hypothetical protein